MTLWSSISVAWIVTAANFLFFSQLIESKATRSTLPPELAKNLTVVGYTKFLLQGVCPKVRCTGKDCTIIPNTLNTCPVCACPTGSAARGCDRMPARIVKEVFRHGCLVTESNGKVTQVEAQRIIRWYRAIETLTGVDECRSYEVPYCNQLDDNLWRGPNTKEECNNICYANEPTQYPSNEFENLDELVPPGPDTDLDERFAPIGKEQTLEDLTTTALPEITTIDVAVTASSEVSGNSSESAAAVETEAEANAENGAEVEGQSTSALPKKKTTKAFNRKPTKPIKRSTASTASPAEGQVEEGEEAQPPVKGEAEGAPAGEGREELLETTSAVGAEEGEIPENPEGNSEGNPEGEQAQPEAATTVKRRPTTKRSPVAAKTTKKGTLRQSSIRPGAVNVTNVASSAPVAGSVLSSVEPADEISEAVPEESTAVGNDTLNNGELFSVVQNLEGTEEAGAENAVAPEVAATQAAPAAGISKAPLRKNGTQLVLKGRPTKAPITATNARNVSTIAVKRPLVASSLSSQLSPAVENVTAEELLNESINGSLVDLDNSTIVSLLNGSFVNSSEIHEDVVANRTAIVVLGRGRIVNGTGSVPRNITALQAFQRRRGGSNGTTLFVRRPNASKVTIANRNRSVVPNRATTVIGKRSTAVTPRPGQQHAEQRQLLSNGTIEESSGNRTQNKVKPALRLGVYLALG